MNQTLVPFSSAQHLVLDNVSWSFYEKVLEEVGDGSVRVTFDDGIFEIMSPLPAKETRHRFPPIDTDFEFYPEAAPNPDGSRFEIRPLTPREGHMRSRTRNRCQSMKIGGKSSRSGRHGWVRTYGRNVPSLTARR